MKRKSIFLVSVILSMVLFSFNAFSEEDLLIPQNEGFGRGFKNFKNKRQMQCDPREFCEMQKGKMGVHRIFQEMPALSESLKEVKENSPEVFHQFMQYCRKNNPLHKLKGAKKHPISVKTKELTEKFLLSELKTFKLVDKYSQASEDEKVTLKKDIRNTLNESFEIKQEIQREFIDSLQKKIAQMKANTDKRATAKNEIIDKRLENLVKNDDVLKW